MPRTSKQIEINTEALREYMEDKGYSIDKLANATGISHSQIGRYLNGVYTPKESEIKLICYILDIELDDVKKKAKAEAPAQTASQLIEDSEIKKEIQELNRKMDSATADLSKMAKLLIEIQKTASEGKAQTEINRESIEIMSNKLTQTNSIVTQINAKIRKSF